MHSLTLEYPLALLLLLGIPVMFRVKRKAARATGFAGGAFWDQRLAPGVIKRHGLDALGALFLSAATLAIVNIRYASVWEETTLESKWMMIVQDLSGSMGRPGGGGQLTLSDLALAGARTLIDLRQEDDLIGLIAFSSYAKLVAPPTFDRNILKQKLKLFSKEANSVLFRELSVGGATNASHATWLALNVFLMLLPEAAQLSVAEIENFRSALVGKTAPHITIPEKLQRIRFGHGMAIVLFTDGRIEANQSDEDVRKGLPNFVNVAQLLRNLGVKLYLIVVDSEVNEDVRAVFEGADRANTAGRIFYMPRNLDLAKIREVYNTINLLEKNRLLVTLRQQPKDTRGLFAWIGFVFLGTYCFLGTTPWFRRIA